MAKDKKTTFTKAKCPNCKASLLVKPSVRKYPG
jgi:hypothetical protein